MHYAAKSRIKHLTEEHHFPKTFSTKIVKYSNKLAPHIDRLGEYIHAFDVAVILGLERQYHEADTWRLVDCVLYELGWVDPRDGCYVRRKTVLSRSGIAQRDRCTNRCHHA